MEVIDKIVDFEKYCDICEYKDYSEEVIPCCYCLDNPVNQNTSIPKEFKKSEKQEKKKKIQEERKVLKTRMRTPKTMARQTTEKIEASNIKPKVAVVDSKGVMNKIKEMYKNE